MKLSVTKQLVCPSSGVVVGLQLSRARTRVAAAPRDPAAADRLAFLERHLDEMVFDIPCPSGHSVLRTMPQLARAIRNSPGEWVDLSR